VDYVVHDILDTEVLMSETQWAAYAPKPSLLRPSPHYTINTYDTIIQAGAMAVFKVERLGSLVL